MTFFSLFSTATSSVLYGCLITIAIMALLYVVLRALNKGIVETLVFYITGAVMAILLIIQMSLMVGAMEAKSSADDAQEFVSQLIGTNLDSADEGEGQNVVDSVIGNYLSSYIWHRVWWSLGIIAVGVIVAIITRKRQTSFILDDNDTDEYINVYTDDDLI